MTEKFFEQNIRWPIKTHTFYNFESKFDEKVE